MEVVLVVMLSKLVEDSIGGNRSSNSSNVEQDSISGNRSSTSSNNITTSTIISIVKIVHVMVVLEAVVVVVLWVPRYQSYE